MYTSQAYNEMIEDIKVRIGADEEPGAIEDVVNHGADSGFSGFTYTNECVEFYDEHKDVIWQMLNEDADDFGYSNPMLFVSSFNRSDMIDSEDGLKNLLAWYALERVCAQLEAEE